MDGTGHQQQTDSNPRPGETPARKPRLSLDEDDTLIRLRLSGMRWEDISKRLSGRTASACLGRYSTYLEQRVLNGKNLHKLARSQETRSDGQQSLEGNRWELAAPSQASFEAVLDFGASREDRAAEVESLEHETARPSHATRNLDRHPSANVDRVEPSPSPYGTHASGSLSQGAPSRLPVSHPQSDAGQNPPPFLQPGLHNEYASSSAPRDHYATQAINALNHSAFRQQSIGSQPRSLLPSPPRSDALNTIPEAEGDQAAATTPTQSSTASRNQFSAFGQQSMSSQPMPLLSDPPRSTASKLVPEAETTQATATTPTESSAPSSDEYVRRQHSSENPSKPWICTKCGRRFCHKLQGSFIIKPFIL